VSVNRKAWQFSSEITLDEVSDFLRRRDVIESVGAGEDEIEESSPNLDLIRSKDGLIEVEIFKSRVSVGETIESIRNHWSLLRRKGLAAASPIRILTDSFGEGNVAYIYKWAKATSRTIALADDDISALRKQIKSQAARVGLLSSSNEIYQGFDHEQFPKTGGVELLRGKCTCSLEVDGLEGQIELDGQNGFVIMHRGPAYELVDEESRVRIMDVRILQHGADSPLPMPLPVREMLSNEPEAALRIRVEQNPNLPQYGVIRAQTPENDFPATAMWIVHWRIHTPVGTIITDPNVPLVFGPTTVNHYPPVGTEFLASTGEVDVYNVETGTVVGKLIPGELTAFDIVVTMDDEVPSLLDAPPRDHIEMFNSIVNNSSLRIPFNGTISFDPLQKL
jgi:hypothetical protein